MELIISLLIIIPVVLVGLFVVLTVFAWLADVVFGIDASWLDYGIDEDEL